MPRFVFHCTPHAPVAMIVAAPGFSGKTNLSFRLEHRGIPTSSTDTLLLRLVMREDRLWRPLARKLVERFGAGRPASLQEMGMFIIDNK